MMTLLSAFLNPVVGQIISFEYSTVSPAGPWIAAGAPIDFGGVDRDNGTATVYFRLTDGGVGSTVECVSVGSYAGPNADEYTASLSAFDLAGCLANTPQSTGTTTNIGAGLTEVFSVTFDPDNVAGLGAALNGSGRRALIHFDYDAGLDFDIWLDGTGTEAQLSLTKALNGNANPVLGETVTFTLTLTNNQSSEGPGASATASGMTIVDTLPVGFTNVGSPGPDVAVLGNEITWTPSVPLAPGASIQITVSGDVAYGEIADGDFENTASITTFGQADTVPGNDSSTDATVAPVGVAVLIADPLGANSIVASGGGFDFGSLDLWFGSSTVTFRYFNGTFDTATVDCVDLSFKQFAGEYVVGGFGVPTSCGVAGDDVILASGAYLDFTVTFDPDNLPASLGPFAPRATLDVVQLAPVATYSVNLDGTATEAELQVTKVLLSDVNPGYQDTVTFLVTLTNNGSSVPGAGVTAVGMTLEDLMGPGYDNVSGISASGVVTESGNVVTWTPAPLAVGASVTLTVTGSVAAGTIAAGDYHNDIAIVGVSQADTNPANDLDGDTTVEPDGYISAPGDVLTLVYDPVDGRIEIHDALGSEVPSLVTDWNDFSGGLFVTGQDLVVDYTGSAVIDPIPSDGVMFQGAGTTASMTLDGNVGGVVVTDMEFLFDNENDGSIVIDGEAIAYTNLKPINDFLVAASKSFDYTGVMSPVFHTITLNEGTVLGDGLSFIDCANCGEEVTFLNPTVDLTITGGDGDNAVCEGDHIIAGKLDLPLAPTFVNMYLNGGAGEDLFTVTPKAVDDIWVDGGTPNTGGVACVCGDRLDLDLTGITTADLDVVNAATGTGIWTFNAPYLPVHFTNIEGHLDADVAVTVDVTPDIAYATDFLDVVITVTNTGADMATCASVIVPGTLLNIFSEDGFAVTPVLAYFDENGNPVAALGSYTQIDSTWTINGLDAGYSATFTISGLVSNFQLMPEEFPITAASNGSTSTVVFETSPGFQFPLTTFVNAATYHTQYLAAVPTWNDDGTVMTPQDLEYDHLIVGLFQGAPGITGAVWCKVPTVITFLGGGDDQIVWPGDNAAAGSNAIDAGGVETLDPPSESLGDLWRPCSGTMGDVTADVDPLVPNIQPSIALPFPLHVNDLFVDDMMTPGDPTDDVIYLATWGSAGLYKSYDGGHTWSAAWPELGPGDASMGVFWTNIYAITRDAAGFLYASANDGYVIRSLNHGAVWQVVGPLPYVDADTPWALEADIDNAGVVYAGTFGRGVLCTSDYGFNWAVLDNPLTVANENTILYSAPNNAGHIFDFAIADDGADRYLFVATAKGVWRARVASNGDCGLLSAWQFIGPEVKLADNTVVRPEVHALALLDDAVLDADLDGTVDLLAGLWGNFLVGGDLISAYKFEDPFAIPLTPIYEPFQLKGVQIESFAVSPSGQLAAVTNRGLKFFDMDQASTSTATEEAGPSELPTEFALDQNYPNPFNPVTTITYSVAESAKVRLAVYDVLGRQVALLADGLMQAGRHEVRFDAANLPSGTYLYRLQTPVGSYSKTLVLMK